jgi:hypothetical protein
LRIPIYESSLDSPQKLTCGSPKILYGTPHANFLWRDPMEFSMDYFIRVNIMSLFKNIRRISEKKIEIR